MRSLFSFGASKEMSLAMAGSGHRPEVMRRAALADNARILLALSALGLPLSIYMLIGGNGVPFFVNLLWLAGAAATLLMHRNGGYTEAAAGQVAAITGGGAVLTLVDPNLADFGLAVAVLGPVLASLLADARVRAQSWVLLGLITAVAVTLSLAGVPPIAEGAHIEAVGAVVFAVAAVIVAHSANRINFAYEVYDKAQVTAYRHLIENVRDAVLRFSQQGELLFASQSCEELFGCRRYELSGPGLGERVHVADRPAYLTAFADANKAGAPRTIEVRMRRDGMGESRRVPQYFWAEIAFSPIADADNREPWHEVVALVRDVSERKDHEAEMRAARKTAEQASEAKSRFLATIGHELRTPLNAVVGFSDMMMHGIGGDLSDTQREYAGLIHQSGKHLLEVVGMLLDMSRIEAGRFELQAEMLAPETLIDPCFQIVEGLARERKVTLTTEIAYPLPSVMADERACRQVLINLLSNAIKFSHEGGAVSVAMKRQGQSLNISVADRGIGMEPSAIGRIGEPFFQANDGLDRKHEGTGLGLSIVKGLVELHQGTLRAISEVGAGTTVTVLLPLNGPAINVVETMPVAAAPREPASPQSTSWQDEKRKAL